MKRTRRDAMTAGALLVLGLSVGPGAVPASAQDSEEEKKLLKVGQVAPDFTLPLVTGGEVTLGNLLKFGKAVLVGFWGIEEEDGGAELAMVQKLHNAMQAKGLTTITINPVDPAGDVRDHLKEEKIEIQVAIDGKETNRAVTNVYKAKKLPTYYLLDPDAKVLWRSIGFKEAGLREALVKAGVN